MSIKKYKEENVLVAARSRVKYAFDNFERIYISFSGGKDSSVMFHLVMDEAIARKRKVGVLLIDLEAQYKQTVEHAVEMFALYRDYIDLHWVCLPMLLRNAVSAFEPRWCCWEPGVEWVRELPKHDGVISDPNHFDFFKERMEFEEFMVLFGLWYGKGQEACGFVGIRSDESLNRFRTVVSKKKECHGGKLFTTKVEDELYNIYPIYDWRTEDIWTFHARFPDKPHNAIYDRMHMAGLGIHQQRLCQPYGDDQRRGLWLYHILEPATWFKLVTRVSGANSGSLYINENGNINGYQKVSKPAGHTWKSFVSLLLNTLPPKTRDHYHARFSSFISGWKRRGYVTGIPDEAPRVLENKHWAPSWRRMAKVILRNDHWCKGLGLTQPKSEAYSRYMHLKKRNRDANPSP
jgi:predicted phosphoadenosine phosphosulfate sulfurtransferase